MTIGTFPHIQGVRFLVGARAMNQLPTSGLPEIAVAGRSNVGKSSLLRTLVNQRSLVRVSRTPGRTREVNFFLLESKDLPPLHLVDLPGYGYASVPRSLREDWGDFVSRYLETSATLSLVLLLVDARREPGELEVQFTDWMLGRGVRVQVVVTKIDQVPKTQWGQVEARIRAAFGPELPRCIFYSSLKSIGNEDVWRKIKAAVDRAPVDRGPAGGAGS
jgi:GTP-binding protein